MDGNVWLIFYLGISYVLYDFELEQIVLTTSILNKTFERPTSLWTIEEIKMYSRH